MRHSRDNPIVVEDNKEEEMLASGSGEGLLVKIVDKTPKQEIVDDCEEHPEV